MKTLKDLIGQTVILTFRNKSVSQFKAYNILDYVDGFFQLQGIEGDAGKLSETIWWQNVSDVSTIIEQAPVKPTVQQPKVKPTAKAVIPAKKVSSRPGPSKNRLLGKSG
jgi:hypothetical protein